MTERVKGLTAEMSARARGLIERMGEVASAMWRTSADAYGDGALDVGQRLEERDDEMDELHVTLMAELASGVMDIPVVIELTLVGRFYERLGDHAVNLAKRVPARAYQASDLAVPAVSCAHFENCSGGTTVTSKCMSEKPSPLKCDERPSNVPGVSPCRLSRVVMPFIV